MLDWLYSKNGHLEVKPDMMTADCWRYCDFINCNTRRKNRPFNSGTRNGWKSASYCLDSEGDTIAILAVTSSSSGSSNSSSDGGGSSSNGSVSGDSSNGGSSSGGGGDSDSSSSSGGGDSSNGSSSGGDSGSSSSNGSGSWDSSSSSSSNPLCHAYQMDAGDPIPEGKVASIPSLSTHNAEIRHAWSFASTPHTSS